MQELVLRGSLADQLDDLHKLEKERFATISGVLDDQGDDSQNIKKAIFPFLMSTEQFERLQRT